MAANLKPLVPDRTFSVEGININYTENIVPNDLPTVVLIHGFGATLETWSDIYPLLCSHYSVLRMDLKGSGFSSKPEDNEYAPGDQARLLLKFLEGLGRTNIVLVGYSLGGGVALLTYFESLISNQHVNVRALILIDSAGYPQSLPFFVETVRNPLTRMISYMMPPASRVRFVLERIIKAPERITDDRIHRYAYFLDMPGSRYALVKTAEQIVPRNISELSDKFSTVAVPTLILWGEDDPVIPVKNGHRFEKDIPGSQFKLLPQTGHLPHEERPKETFTIMDRFLRSLK